MFGCGPEIWIGAAMLLAGIAAFWLGRPRQKAEVRSNGNRLLRILGLSLLVGGVVVAAAGWFQGNCAASPGRCPPEIGGRGFPCESPGSACKVWYGGTGVCRTTSHWWWGCVCKCSDPPPSPPQPPPEPQPEPQPEPPIAP